MSLLKAAAAECSFYTLQLRSICVSEEHNLAMSCVRMCVNLFGTLNQRKLSEWTFTVISYIS